MLQSHPKPSLEDPIRLLYRSYLRWIRNKCILLAMVLVGVWLAGIPHVQWTYQYIGPKRSSVAASEKTSAWYVSVTGWKEVRSGQYGQMGCPMILFVPFRECIGTQSESE